jgi:hypothetical protein
MNNVVDEVEVEEEAGDNKKDKEVENAKENIEQEEQEN